MSDEKVVGIHGHTPNDTDRKSYFMRQCSESYDEYIRRHKEEPDALVRIYGGIGQPVQISWCAIDEMGIPSRNGGAMHHVISAAAMICIHESITPPADER